MKKLVTAILIVTFTLSFCFSCFAAETAFVSLSVDIVKTNRLFDLELSMKCNDKVCGGEFELTYDDSIVEFRDVSSELFEVDAAAKDGKVKILFARAYGKLLDTKTPILSLKFKSISDGAFDTDLISIQCVNEDLKDINVKSTPCTVTVEGSSVKSKSSTKSDGKSGTGKDEEDDYVEEPESDNLTAPDSVYELSGDSTSKTVVFVICGVCGGAALFLLGMLVSKKTGRKDKKSEQDKLE